MLDQPSAQHCARCSHPTDRAEEDALFSNEDGPLCEICAGDLECSACNGHGQIAVLRNHRGEVDYIAGHPTGEKTDCDSCRGTGWID